MSPATLGIAQLGHRYTPDDEGNCWTCGNHREQRSHRADDTAEPPDREPEPGDGPDYHADHAAWASRNQPTVSEHMDGAER